MNNREKSPIRLQADREIASLFDSGYALIVEDFAQVYEGHNLSRVTGRYGVSSRINGGAFTNDTGVVVKTIKFARGRKIYVSATIPLEDTDIDSVKRSILNR